MAGASRAWTAAASRRARRLARIWYAVSGSRTSRTSTVMATMARPNGPTASVTGYAARKPTPQCRTASIGTPNSAHHAAWTGRNTSSALSAGARAKRLTAVLMAGILRAGAGPYSAGLHMLILVTAAAGRTGRAVVSA